MAHSCSSSARQCVASRARLGPPSAAAAARRPHRRAAGRRSDAQKARRAPLTWLRSSGSSQVRASPLPSRPCGVNNEKSEGLPFGREKTGKASRSEQNSRKQQTTSDQGHGLSEHAMLQSCAVGSLLPASLHQLCKKLFIWLKQLSVDSISSTP